MDPIRPPQTSALIESLRKLARAAGGVKTEGGKARSMLLKAVTKPLAEQLRELVVNVDGDQEADIAAVRPAILRCILLHEWGEDVASDPEFARIVNSISDTIESDKRLRDVLRRAVLSLKGDSNRM